MEKAKISTKNQIVVPREIRSKLRLKAGDFLQFVEQDGDVLVRRGDPDENPFERFRGAAPGFNSAKEINAWISEIRGWDPGEDK